MSDFPPGSMPTDGRWGWYKDHEDQQYQRVSTLIKKVETDTFMLDQWRKRQVLVGAARRDDLVLAAKAMRPDPIYGWSDRQRQELNKLIEKAEEAAKDSDGAITGTAVHGLTERLDRGEALDSVIRGLPAQAEMDVRAYAKLIELNGWQVIEIERTVVNEDLNVAGTFDRIYAIPGLAAMLGPGHCQHGCGVGGPGDGHGDELPVIGDVKTEKSPMRNGLHIGPQLAIYSRSRRMWLPLVAKVGSPAAQYVDAPCVRQDVGIVVHVRDGHAVPILVDLNSGWEAARAARAQAGRENAAKNWLVPLPNVIEPRPAELVTDAAVHHDYARPAPDPVLTLPPLAVPATPPEAVTLTNLLLAAPSLSEGSVPTWEATQRPDGMVDWVPAAATEPAIGTQATVGDIGFTKVDSMANVGALGVLDTIDKQAIENIWLATGVEDLAETWRIYTQIVGREWGGRVAEAGAARERQIQCVQRAMHTGSGKCACGWASGILP